MHLTDVSGGVQVYAHMQSVCDRGNTASWGFERRLAVGEADMPVPSVGRIRV